MEMITNTLSLLVERWDDPGDYPNALAAGPLPSYEYIAGLEGELRLLLSEEELAEYSFRESEGEVQEYLSRLVEEAGLLPAGILRVKTWTHQVKKTIGSEKVLVLWDEDGDIEVDFEAFSEPE